MRWLNQITCVALIAVIGQGVLANEVRISDTALRGLIRQAEANGSYSAVYEGLRQRPPQDVREMTVADVLAWQRSLGRVTSTASGGYQFIRSTLGETVRNAGISETSLFDEATQDALAQHKVDECKETAGMSVASFGNCLAGVWAAFPLLSGPNRGQSRHRNVANNRARLTAEDFEQALAGLTTEVVIDGDPYRLDGNSVQVVQPRVVSTPLSRYEQIKAAMAEAQSNGGLGRSIYEAASDG